MTSVILNKDEKHEVQVLNLSRKGLRTQTTGRHKKGDKLQFEFDKGSANVTLSLKIWAKIVNDYGAGINDTNEYGVKFFSLLDWYEMNCIHDFVYKVGKE